MTTSGVTREDAVAADVLDRNDPLGAYVTEFVEFADDGAYFDGNSLGRPPKALAARFSEFLTQEWGRRLIRSWDEGWMELPETLGDRIGAATLGAGPHQTVLGESTTVWLYKLINAAVSARPNRSVIVVEESNFPTDRFVVEGIASQRGLTVRWLRPGPSSGLDLDELRAAAGDAAVVVLSHVSFKSAEILDMAACTEAVHDAGALVLWDLCHSVGVLPIQLDAANVDLAVGCTYKYLNGGPGSPAFAYVATALQAKLVQPIWGWMGDSTPFEMGPNYAVPSGIRRFLSGTPPVLGMLAMQETLEMIEAVGIEAVREKSVLLTEYAIALYDRQLAPYGVELLTTRDSARRGGHVMIGHVAFPELLPRLWAGDVIPDLRPPHGLRIGLSPLSTTYREVEHGMAVISEGLARKEREGGGRPG